MSQEFDVHGGAEVTLPFEMVFEQADIGLCIVSPELHILRTNAAWRRATGLSTDDVVGQSLPELFPENAELIVAVHARTRAGETVAIPRARQVIRGKETWWEATLAPLPLAEGIGTLITAREVMATVQMEQEQERLRASVRTGLDLELLEALIEQLPVGILVVDAGSGDLLLRNPQMDTIWRNAHRGLHPNGVMASPGAFHPDGRPFAPEDWVLARAQRTGESVHLDDTTILRGDGTQGRISSSCSPVHDRFGKVIAWVVIDHDITAQKLVEEQLRTAESQFRSLVEQLPGITYIATADARTTLYVSPQVTQLLGYTRDEWLGSSSLWAKVLHKEDRGRVYAQGRHATITGAPFVSEYRLLARDGHVIWVHDMATIVGDGDGRSRFLQGVMLDITARKEAEIALEEQYRQADRAQSETRAVLDAAGDAMLLISLEGRVLSVNQKFTDFFTITAEEAMGRDLAAFAAIIGRIFAEPERLVALIAATDTNTTRSFTDSLRQRWPQERELAIYTTPVHNAAGHHLGRLYVFRDVSREREVDRMKTEFVSLVSHELRTPLTAIQGYLDVVLNEEVGELSEGQREFLGIVKDNSNRLVSLINDLLDIARIESGRIELYQVPLNLPQIVQSVVTLFGPQVEAKGQRLVVVVPSGLPEVVGDPDRIRQVLTNLVSNAHKYTPEGGSITISVETDNQWVRVAVADTGIGLTVEEQSHLFTKFYRASNRTTQEVKGTGLGLAISRSVIELHGGQMSVASTQGQGSIFSFTLPLVPAVVAPSPEPPQETY